MSLSSKKNKIKKNKIKKNKIKKKNIKIQDQKHASWYFKLQVRNLNFG